MLDGMVLRADIQVGEVGVGTEQRRVQVITENTDQ